MILFIILLIIFLMLLILINFFTVYFIIPSIKDNKHKDDPLIPKTITPQPLPKQRLITPYDTVTFIENLVKPIPMNEKIQLLKDTSENLNNFYVLNKVKESSENETQVNPNQENMPQETSKPVNANSENQKSEIAKNGENTTKKDFKIWRYCYRILKRFKII